MLGVVGHCALGTIGRLSLQAAGALPYVSPALVLQTQLQDMIKLTSSIVEMVQQHETNRESNFRVARKVCDVIQATALNLSELEPRDDPYLRFERAVFIIRELHGVVLLIHEHFETLFSRIGVSRFITISADTKENMRFFNELDLALRRDTLTPSSPPKGAVPLKNALVQAREAVDCFVESLQTWRFDVPIAVHV